MDPQQREIAREFNQYRDSYSSTVNDALSFSGLDVDFFTRVKVGYIKDIVSDEFKEPEKFKRARTV